MNKLLKVLTVLAIITSIISGVTFYKSNPEASTAWFMAAVWSTNSLLLTYRK